MRRCRSCIQVLPVGREDSKHWGPPAELPRDSRWPEIRGLVIDRDRSVRTILRHQMETRRATLSKTRWLLEVFQQLVSGLFVACGLERSWDSRSRSWCTPAGSSSKRHHPLPRPLGTDLAYP